MKRFPKLSLLTLIVGSLTQAACGTGGGYNQTPWQYQKPGVPAQEKPNALSEPFVEAAPPTEVIAETLDGSPLPQSAQTAPAFTPRPDLPPVKVGVLLPLSGSNAELGQAMLNAAQMALFDVGHNSFELVPRDTKGTAEGAKTAAREVLSEGAQLVLGPIFAAEVRAAKTITKSAGINMVAFSTDWTIADNSTYVMGFMPFDQVRRVLSHAAQNGVKNVGIFAPASDYGNAIMSAYKNAAPAAGLNTVQIKRFGPDGKNLPAEMQAFANGPPIEAFLMPAGGQQARQIASLAAQYGLPAASVRQLGTGLWDDPALATETNLNGGWFAAPSPALRDGFERNYAQTFGNNAPRLATLAYDATALAAVLARNGLEKGAKPSFDSISIQNPSGFAGIDGIFRFREGGLVERGLAVLEFRNGTTQIVSDAPQSFEQAGY
jgi:ABC-type branched-subunit amino acid transport system substrate-binding protein